MSGDASLKYNRATPKDLLMGRLAASATLFLMLAVPTEGLRTQEIRRIDELRLSLERGDYETVGEGAESLLRSIENRDGSESLELAQVIDLLLQSRWRSGGSLGTEERALAERALRIWESAGREQAELVVALDNLGVALRDAGELEKSIRAFERSLSIREETIGREHADVAKNLNQLGWTYSLAAEFALARDCYERGLQIREDRFGADHAEVAASLNNLAILEKTVGDYTAARRLYERALTIHESVYGQDHARVATTLSNLANLLRAQGELAEAQSLYERSLRIREGAKVKSTRGIARTLKNLAVLHQEMGDPQVALGYSERAVEILETSLGENHPSLASALNNLGVSLEVAGDYARAESVLSRTLEIREKSLGPNHPAVAITLSNLAELYVDLDDLDRAKPSIERAIEIREFAFGPTHPSLAASLRTYADLLARTGDHDNATRQLERALAIYRQQLGPEHPEVADTSSELALLCASTGDSNRAFVLSLDADRIGRDHLRLMARAVTEGTALRYATVRPEGQNLALTLVAERKVDGSQAVPSAWDAVIRSRALVLDEMKTRHESPAKTDALSADLAGTSERFAQLLVRGPSGSSPERYQQLLSAARAARDEAEGELGRASMSFRRRRAAAETGFLDVAAALPSGSALVAYVRYDHHHLPKSGSDLAEKYPLERTGRYLAFTLRSGQTTPSVVPLGESSRIDALVGMWRDEILSVRGALPALGASAERRFQLAVEPLRQAVWDPVRASIGKPTRIFIVLDGTLQTLNLATLPSGNGRYLVEKSPPLHYLTTERGLVEADRPAKAGNGALFVGGAKFGDTPADRAETDACGGLGGLEFEALVGSAHEVEELAALLSSQGPESQRTRVEILTGDQAMEEALKTAAPGYGILHMATHGFVASEPGSCSSGPASSAPRIAATLAPEPSVDAALISGLALAGANRGVGDRAGAGSDGLLTTAEIRVMDLSGMEWVVLSGCDTGLGKQRAGEGLLGLRRAFETAGANTLIMSLWPVDDASSLAWMRRLYKGRLEELGSADAIWRASLETLRMRRENRLSAHPFYWGAYVGVGDWR